MRVSARERGGCVCDAMFNVCVCVMLCLRVCVCDALFNVCVCVMLCLTSVCV